MREVVSVHVGQCGNQIGSAFWNLLLLEHEQTKDSDPALSSFFSYEPANGSHRRRTSSTLGSGKKSSSMSSGGNDHVLKARALLIDMECGPLTETMKGPLGSLFSETQYIMDVSGAGNNFAHGYYFYGPQYHEKFLDHLAHTVEACDSLQAFFLTHSLGGGTGSGVGTYLLHLLYDEYSKVTRFSTCVYPSEENDVITSPYNTIFATKQLIQCADCVFPINNSSLFAISQLESPPQDSNGSVDATSATQVKVAGVKSKSRSRGFDSVNNIVARMLCHLTSSSRFNGEMNVDLNEVYTNLVPFPRLHFLMTALNVRYPPNSTVKGRSMSNPADHSRMALQRAFGDITSVRGQLSGLYTISNMGNSKEGVVTTASAFLARGKVKLSDFIGCVTAAQRNIRFPSWNQDACKVRDYPLNF
jgi:tubulin epsilon